MFKILFFILFYLLHSQLIKSEDLISHLDKVNNVQIVFDKDGSLKDYQTSVRNCKILNYNGFNDWQMPDSKLLRIVNKQYSFNNKIYYFWTLDKLIVSSDGKLLAPKRLSRYHSLCLRILNKSFKNKDLVKSPKEITNLTPKIIDSPKIINLDYECDKDLKWKKFNFENNDQKKTFIKNLVKETISDISSLSEASDLNIQEICLKNESESLNREWTQKHFEIVNKLNDIKLEIGKFNKIRMSLKQINEQINLKKNNLTSRKLIYQGKLMEIPTNFLVLGKDTRNIKDSVQDVGKRIDTEIKIFIQKNYTSHLIISETEIENYQIVNDFIESFQAGMVQTAETDPILYKEGRQDIYYLQIYRLYPLFPDEYKSNNNKKENESVLLNESYNNQIFVINDLRDENLPNRFLYEFNKDISNLIIKVKNINIKNLKQIKIIETNYVQEINPIQKEINLLITRKEELENEIKNFQNIEDIKNDELLLSNQLNEHVNSRELILVSHQKEYSQSNKDLVNQYIDITESSFDLLLERAKSLRSFVFLRVEDNELVETKAADFYSDPIPIEYVEPLYSLTPIERGYGEDRLGGAIGLKIKLILKGDGFFLSPSNNKSNYISDDKPLKNIEINVKIPDWDNNFIKIIKSYENHKKNIKINLLKYANHSDIDEIISSKDNSEFDMIYGLGYKVKNLCDNDLLESIEFENIYLDKNNDLSLKNDSDLYFNSSCYIPFAVDSNLLVTNKKNISNYCDIFDSSFVGQRFFYKLPYNLYVWSSLCRGMSYSEIHNEHPLLHTSFKKLDGIKDHVKAIKFDSYKEEAQNIFKPETLSQEVNLWSLFWDLKNGNLSVDQFKSLNLLWDSRILFSEGWGIANKNNLQEYYDFLRFVLNKENSYKFLSDASGKGFARKSLNINYQHKIYGLNMSDYLPSNPWLGKYHIENSTFYKNQRNNLYNYLKKYHVILE